jgi:hypothetical protein
MDFAFERHVYCHDLINPPTQSGSCDVDLKLTNSTGLINIERVKTESAESVYMMTVPSGNNLSFMTGEQAALEIDFTNLVLAFNLTQKRICMNYKKGDFPSFKVTPKAPASRTNVTKLDSGYHIHTEDTIVLRDEAYATIHIWGDFDENKVADIFQKIQKLRRFERKSVSQLQVMNLNDALSKYESGISEFEGLIKFKHFFNSLELVTNMAGRELKGDDFDNEVQRIASVSKTDTEEWRQFYNRTKHVQKGSDDINKYYNGVDTLPDKLLAIRTNLNEILLSKL